MNQACKAAEFTDSIFADDLHAYKIDTTGHDDKELFSQGSECQTQVHRWGDANGVQFEGTKESLHIFIKSAALWRFYRDARSDV